LQCMKRDDDDNFFVGLFNRVKEISFYFASFFWFERFISFLEGMWTTEEVSKNKRAVYYIKFKTFISHSIHPTFSATSFHDSFGSLWIFDGSVFFLLYIIFWIILFSSPVVLRTTFLIQCCC
jgi:hypothetical protein